MNNNEYKAYLKNNYTDKVRQLKSVDKVIFAFNQKIDIVKTELSESEEIFLKMTVLNYRYVYDKMDLDSLNFISYEILRNEKSENYYSSMKGIISDDDRIIVIIEPQLNEITSNSQDLKVDMLIERGIDNLHIEKETPEFFSYLMFFDKEGS